MKLENKLIFGVDEITVMLFGNLQEIQNMSEWAELAENIIDDFEIKSSIIKVFGDKRSANEALPSGYNLGYNYGNNPFYFSVAYNLGQPKMGVIVKFSAYAWNHYISKQVFNLIDFLNIIGSSFYDVRLSRLDLTADYINWDFEVDEIYEHLLSGRYLLIDSKHKKNHSKLTAYEVDGNVETFYVGSKRTGTRLFMRVYNKKLEQLENYGFRHTEALKVDSWVRFEVVFKSKYAHQMTEILKETIPENINYLIANKIAEKYQFFDTETEDFTSFSAALKFDDNEFQNLTLDSPRNNNIVSSLNHIVNGSGLLTSMFKCDSVWGNGTAITLLAEIYQIYNLQYIPSQDAEHWLSKNFGTLSSQNFKEDILPAIQIKKPLSRRKIRDNGNSLNTSK